ncbi:acylneuraminate cytidylyltransferase family protein [Rhodobacteraceae bacterium M385]|nr:acylneuraminate cytidylyltransferase family protein [Rhodobacteraceae bacterium M385]
MVSNIAIIPARGGSKRIPRKNIISFQNRPMIGWTIEAALQSGVFERVVVSTDDAEIAEISLAEGADVPFLREVHADDQSPVSDAVISALKQAETHYGTRFETVTQLMANCPLRGGREIHAAWENFQGGAHRFQISAFEFGWMNPWWAARIKPDGQPDWMFTKERQSRSQDLERLYCPTGAIWIADSEALTDYGSFYGPGHVLCPMPWQAAVDIDDWHDFQMAEALALVAAQNAGADV